MARGMITLQSKGSFKSTEAFLRRMSDNSIFALLDRYGQEGVAALANATPTRTGLTARSWSYKVVSDSGSHSLQFHNTNMVDGTPVAILIQYGHGTGTGGYVTGIDFINPIILPLFERIAADIWKAVTQA